MKIKQGEIFSKERLIQEKDTEVLLARGDGERFKRDS